MKMQIGEIAKKSGVTVRTLQYYDSIGLLKPAEVSENGFFIMRNRVCQYPMY